MVKLSKQINGFRETRTQRLKQQRQATSEKLNQEFSRFYRALDDVGSLEEYEREYEKLSPELKRRVTSPQQLRQEIQTLQQSQVQRLEYLIRKREEKIQAERNKNNPNEEKIERLQEEIDALDRGRDDLARGASLESVFKSARGRGRAISFESVKTRPKGERFQGGATYQDRFGKKYFTNKEGKLVAVEDPKTRQSRLSNQQDNLEFQALKRQQEQYNQEQSSRMSIAPGIARERYTGTISEFQPSDRFQSAKIALLKERQSNVGDPLQFEKGVALGAVSAGVSNAEFLSRLVSDPEQSGKDVALGVVDFGQRVVDGRGFPEAGRVVEQEPGFALGYTGTELLIAKGYGELGKAGIELGGRAVTRLSPKFKRIKTSSSGKKFIEVTGEEGAIKQIELLEPGLSKIDESVSTQAQKQLKDLDSPRDVASGQRGLFGLFEKEKVVFKESSTPLERSFFVDPYGRLRTSRLGLESQRKAKLIDVLTGDVTLKPQRPQALFFENVMVESLPKSLKGIEAKLLRGQALTGFEQSQLLKFQLTPSGKFKPIGFLSREPELTLAPGEIIRKQRLLGETIIQGKRVPIYQTAISTSDKAMSNVNKIVKEISSKSLTDEAIMREVNKIGGMSSQRISPSLSPSKIASSSLSLTKGFSKPSQSILKASYSPASKLFGSYLLGFVGSGGSLFSSSSSIPRRGVPPRSPPRRLPPRSPPSLPPSIINPRPPVKPPIKFELEPKSRKKKKKKKRFKSILAYFPDFTTKALGLDPIKLTSKQTREIVKQVQTGFEIRRGVLIN